MCGKVAGGMLEARRERSPVGPWLGAPENRGGAQVMRLYLLRVAITALGFAAPTGTEGEREGDVTVETAWHRRRAEEEIVTQSRSRQDRSSSCDCCSH
ncbi:hypothetical protein JCGZ_22190 [Jatropha curcas]|uniref:Uncharacterized protein n=1 Tax=Jatropha curcas TaxID=180498 RepID=A0A067K3X8_JATCU|nr:hypothetical protein JCGZ_22190 [Jatropha curcas]